MENLLGMVPGKVYFYLRSRYFFLYIFFHRTDEQNAENMRINCIKVYERNLNLLQGNFLIFSFFFCEKKAMRFIIISFIARCGSHGNFMSILLISLLLLLLFFKCHKNYILQVLTCNVFLLALVI